jgi:hypothetical protein
MKIRNVWFDLTPFLGFLALLSWSVFAVVGYFRGEIRDLAAVALKSIVILLLAACCLWMSLFLGGTQERARNHRVRDNKENE